MSNITVLSRATDECGEAVVLICNATVVKNLFAPPIIFWWYNGYPVPTVGNPRMNSSTGQLIFDDITLDNSGVYTCRANITIQEAGIENYYREITVSATTSSKEMNLDIFGVYNLCYTAPKAVHNLRCKGSNSPSRLALSWDEVDEAHGSSNVSYRVEAMRVQHKSLESREQESVPLTPAYRRDVMDTHSQVTHGLGMLIHQNLFLK